MLIIYDIYDHMYNYEFISTGHPSWVFPCLQSMMLAPASHDPT